MQRLLILKPLEQWKEDFDRMASLKKILLLPLFVLVSHTLFSQNKTIVPFEMISFEELNRHIVDLDLNEFLEVLTFVDESISTVYIVN